MFRPGRRPSLSEPACVSLNFEQQVSDSLGVFGRAGWADGNVEPWDFADIDRTTR